MKKFIKENKSYIKSISLVLLSEAFIYFCIKTIIKDYNILTPKINFPVISFFSIIYNSWYPFLFLIAYTIFKKDETTYKKYIYTIIIGAILAEITFITYPTMVIRPDIEIKNIFDYILHLTYYFDTPAINCLPSVHCLFCFISIYYITITPKLKTKIKLPIIIYFTLIILSTFFTIQHILIDGLLAFIYSVIAILTVKIFYNQINKVLKLIF